MKHTKFKPGFLAVVVAGHMMLMVPVAVSQGFIMEGGTIQTAAGEQSAVGYVFQGGVMPIGIFGEGGGYVMEPLATPECNDATACGASSFISSTGAASSRSQEAAGGSGGGRRSTSSQPQDTGGVPPSGMVSSVSSAAVPAGRASSSAASSETSERDDRDTSPLSGAVSPGNGGRPPSAASSLQPGPGPADGSLHPAPRPADAAVHTETQLAVQSSLRASLLEGGTESALPVAMVLLIAAELATAVLLRRLYRYADTYEAIPAYMPSNLYRYA